ncbi:MAG: hypothetical protein IPI90_15680 [Saprospiraceae bacterium]|nr:hypothetical protein [Candidatus Vicinibacter affinis]
MMVVCGVDFAHEISAEFEQCGLTLKASKVQAPMALESPVNMECVVQEIIPLGDQVGQDTPPSARWYACISKNRQLREWH